MKLIYETPCAEVIDLAAMESIALLDGHPLEGKRNRSGDEGDEGVFSTTVGVGDGHF